VLCKKCGSYNPDGSEYCSVCKEPLLVKGPSSIRQKIDADKLLLQIKSTLSDRYFITRFIGEGAFAQVYYAIDKATNTGVALKVFKSYVFKNEDEMSRLVWGVRGIKDISHPNLVRIFDADIAEEGWVFVSMKFIYGMSLLNTIRLRVEVGKPFSFEEIEPLFYQMGEILNEMHPTICHGDFKPSNIIIQPDYIKLTDATILSYINLSNCLKELKSDPLSIYLAPEVLEGGEPSYRSDIFSCGRILRTLLSGSESVDLDKVELFKYNKEIDNRLKGLIKKATSSDPLARHNDINEFNSELFDILAAYNELPQNIKDEYHQSISAVEAKFTHIKQSQGIDREVKNEKEKTKSRKGIIILTLVITFLVLLIGFFVFKDRIFFEEKRYIYSISYDISEIPSSEDISDTIASDELAYRDDVTDVSGLYDITPAEMVLSGKEEESRAKKAEKIEKREIKPKTATIKEEGAVEERQKEEKEAVKEKEKSGPCPKDMVYIKAGSFKMGSLPSDEGRQPDELAFVTVQTGSYCIDKYEYPNKKGAIPRTSVTFNEADKLCAEQGKRLCSEEEWERACKGVSMVKYPYDNVFDPTACNAESNTGEERSIAPSGKFPRCKSSYGVYDMSGNVAEWVYMKNSEKGVKGGYVNKPDWAVRCASRKVEPPSKKSPYYGFRCCMDAEE